MKKRLSALAIVTVCCALPVTTACGGAEGSEGDAIESESSALTTADVGASESSAPESTRQAVAEAASCTATSDGGKWCCSPCPEPPYLKCTYTPPPPVISTLTLSASALAARAKLVQ